MFDPVATAPGSVPSASFAPQQLLQICTDVHTLVIVGYEWDAKKAASNLRKHGIDFADAATVFEDESALTVDDEDPEEKRLATIGMDALARVLVVVYTWRREIFGSFLRAALRRASSALMKRAYEKAIRFQ